MTYTSIRIILSFLLPGMLLAACSGGESGTGFSPNQPEISLGAITGFGSIYVNGVEYDTSKAEIYVNDSPATEQDLSIGMIVAVVGSSNRAHTNGKADVVYYENEVSGMVIHNDQAGTMEIMGQTVNYDADTLFDSAVVTAKSIAEIPVGAVVEVSGYRTGANILQATHLMLISSSYSVGGQIIVKGVINTLNGDKFTLGNITVAVDTSTQIAENIPNQQLTAGMNITVKSQRGLLNGELLADKIQLNKRAYAVTGDSVEVEGIVKNLDAQAGVFWLNGYTVTFSVQTEINGGGVGLADGVIAKVEGDLVYDDQIQARKINFNLKNNTDLIARVSNVDAAHNQLSILGTTVQVTNDTWMKDFDQHLRHFSLSNVSSGDKIQIKAYKDETTSTITASQFRRLEANSKDTNVELQGVLEQYSATKIVVAGISVDISSVVSPTLSAADIGRVITVKGTATDNATEILATLIVP